ncbi:MAG: NAD(P)/FAD-dependent oxidoreductase [Actinobacteria bacterium]|nr:NAD(P)/FAD-dependent oxidoreductase [Actinomycetota bacterium]MCL5882929.1 NAD(P)/FAD-dependent oxidoreductase [Actinomycetota bacterium]
MADKHYDFLIIGGGLACANAAKELARLGHGGGIGILAEEKEAPYDRPPLSNEYMLGDFEREWLFLLNEDFRSEHGIELHLGNAAAAVDAAAHEVTAADGSRYAYGKLLIASGCHLRLLTIPGSDLPGLYYLRTLAESEAIREAALHANQAVVIGGGFIGLEAASVLSQIGLDVKVVHRGDRLFEKFASDEISTFFEELYASRGVHTVYEDEAVRLNGGSRVEMVETKASRTLPCDMAVAGIGVWPDTGYLEGSGLMLDNGVVVNEFLEAKLAGAGPGSGVGAAGAGSGADSGAADVYAAGDIANFMDVIYGKQRRIEHWDNAIRQGRCAAANMAGKREEFRNVSYFYSTVFGLTFDFLGDMSGFDEVVTLGSFEEKSVMVLYLREGALRAAFLLGRSPKEKSEVSEMIANRQPLKEVQSRLAS